MASEEQIRCADTLRKLHRRLRCEAIRDGVDAAWQKHTLDDRSLQDYADAMHRLGQIWKAAPSPAVCRLNWVRNQLEKYWKEGRDAQRRRELTWAERLAINMSVPEINENSRVLDVGSCYNPFKDWSGVDVVPIDLHPATEDVYRCDFLTVRLGNEFISSNNTITQLDANSYDAVIFSLLLEYLPTPEQRLQCCRTAYELLKHEGVLMIISPDSKHVGANAKIYKNWRYILSQLGFSRVLYEKNTFLHCMMFRKALHPNIARQWATLHKESYMNELMNIPQDFHIDDVDNDADVRVCFDSSSVAELFNELPPC